MKQKNHNYGKLIDGRLIYAPRELLSTVKDEQDNDVEVTVFNPSDYLYRLCGWLPVVVDPIPDDNDKSYSPVYSEESGTIYQRWQAQYMPPSPPSIEEQIEANAEAIMELAELIGGMLQ